MTLNVECGGWDRLAVGRTLAFEAFSGFLQLGIETAYAEPDERCFHSVDYPMLDCDEARALTVGSPLIFGLDCGTRGHLAVITLAAQPAEKGAFEQFGVEPVSLGASMLARYGYARCVNDLDLNVACSEPARTPEAVTAGLEGDSNAFYPMSCLLRFFSPSMQQFQQCVLFDPKLLQPLALDTRNDTGNEPARLAHLDDGDQRAVGFEGRQGSTKIVQFLHGAAPSVHISGDGCSILAAAP